MEILSILLGFFITLMCIPAVSALAARESLKAAYVEAFQMLTGKDI